MLNFENLGEKFVQIIHTEEWKKLQEKFNNSNDIYVLGHGGNLAIADHAAVDITRLSNGRKNAMCPGSGVVATSLINDTSGSNFTFDPSRFGGGSIIQNSNPGSA